MSPSSGPYYGETAVALRGSGYRNVTAVLFGEVRSPFFRVESDSLIIAASPPSAVDLTIAVTVVAGGHASLPAIEASFTYIPGRWKPTAGPSQCQCEQRVSFTSTLLADGRVLVTGGEPEPGSIPLRSGKLYDPTSRTWTPARPMPEGRTGHSATLLGDGTVLITGGGSRQTFVYDPLADAWAVRRDSSVGRDRSTATLLTNGKILVAGGVQGVPSAEIYDPESDTWDPTPTEMRLGRFGHTATLLTDGKVLVAGGSLFPGEGTVFPPMAEIYDPETGAWLPAGAMGTGRANHTAARLPDGKVLVVGGSPNSDSSELYDASSGTWHEGPPLVTARSRHTSTVLPDGRVLVAGGISGEEALTSSEIFDPRRTEFIWQQAGTLHAARQFATSIGFSDGTVLLTGDRSSDEMWYGVAGDRAPLVMGLDPVEGPSTGGTAVAIEGADLFGEATEVVFGGTASSSVHFESATRMVATSPPRAPGAVPLTVTTLYGSSKAGSASFSYQETSDPTEAPVVFSLHPPSGPPEGGSTVVITGTSLHPLLEVRFGDVVAATRSASDERIHVITPPHPPGPVAVTVVTPRGKSTGSYAYANPAGTWRSTGSSAAARYSHTATRLDGPACRGPNERPPSYCGKILVAGGTNSFYPDSEKTLSSSELYDPDSGTWSLTGAMAAPRYAHTATLLPSGRVLVVGGQASSGGGLASAELYDPGSGTWSEAGMLMAARFSHTATLLDWPACHTPAPPRNCGKVLVAGGTTNFASRGHSALPSTELYDPSGGAPVVGSSGTWSPSGDLRTPRADHTATMLPDGRVLVAGGGTGDGAESNLLAFPPINAVEIYDPQSERWTEAAGLSVARLAHTATLLYREPCGTNCGKVLVVGGMVAGYGMEGGHQQPVFLDSVEVYDPATDTWSPGPSLYRRRGGHGVATLADGSVLVAGGGTPFDVHTDRYVPIASAERYDPVTERWSYAGEMGASRGVPTATLLEGPACRVAAPAAWCGKVLVAGGAGDAEGTTAGDAPPPRRSAELFAASAEVNGLSPSRGPAAGGTEVVIGGEALAGASAVRFGGAPATAFRVDSPTQITAHTPPGRGGPVAVEVVNDAGSSAPSGPSRFVYVDRPGPVGDLVAEATSETSVRLRFSAPDDGTTLGPATVFEIKQSEGPIAEADFDAPGALCEGGRCTVKAGEAVVVNVDGLRRATTYHYRLRALNELGAPGPVSNLATITTGGEAPSRCTPVAAPGPGQVAYPGGQYSIAGGPTGSLLVGASSLFSWMDRGAGGAYEVSPASRQLTGGHGYWAWFACPAVVDLGVGAPTSASLGLSAYHASMVANPSARGPARVSGYDYAAAWDPAMNGGAGGYHISGYREPESLPVGRGIWVFSYRSTVVHIDG